MLDVTTDRVVVADTPQPVAPDAYQAGCGSHPAWAVVQSHPQAERWALENLTRQGYSAYLPLHTVRRRDNAIRCLWHPVEVPLFGGYLFVVPGTHWGPICHTLGVRKLLMSGPRPGFVADSLVAALRATETARRSFSVVGPGFAPGAAVRVCEGALEGHEAVVITTHADRAHIAVMLFGASRNVNVSLDALSVRE
jgi:transcriptional antiterminator RfaH